MRTLDLKAPQVLALASGRKHLHALDMRTNSEPTGHWSSVLDRLATIDDLDWGAHEYPTDRCGGRGSQCSDACERRRANGLFCGVFVDGDPWREGEYLHVPGNGGETSQRVRCVHMVGDVLRVREPWRTSLAYDEEPAGCVPDGTCVRYEADLAIRPPGPHVFGELRHERSMPAWASRYRVTVRSVQACRVQDIDTCDARKLGHGSGDDFRADWHARHRRRHTRWNRNPWIWVLGIEVTTC